MPLSTSNSRLPTKRHVALLVGMCALFCVSVEVVTAHFFGRVSHIENRREIEYKRAVSIRPADQSHKASALVVGNSLLLEGVNFGELQKDIGPEIDLHRMVVENTFFFDWYYGLRRLFKMGSQPSTVVLVLNPIQLTSKVTNGDYSVHFLVDGRDLPSFAKEIGADRNKQSSMALASLSFFYGSRAEIRNWVLGSVLPDLPSITHLFHAAPSLPNSLASRELMSKRLTQVRQLCTEHGATLVLVLPPAIQEAGIPDTVRAAAQAGVKVLVPIAPGALPLTDYSDSLHLNAIGAEKFTPALAEDLKPTLFASSNDRVEAVGASDAVQKVDRTVETTVTVKDPLQSQDRMKLHGLSSAATTTP